MNWEHLDWAVLDRLRDCFLSGAPSATSYWNSPVDLANYDFTYAERIGWKWDAILNELRFRGWTPPSGRPLLDWGCGSGMAGRRVLECFGAHQFASLRVFDRSLLAMDFAVAAAQKAFPALPIERAEPARLDSGDSVGVLVISHVLNELNEAGGLSLRQMVDRAEAVLWVEPGTSADSRALSAVREQLRIQFDLIAPCPHQNHCGMLVPENERHWCHHFASPPPGIMADPDWVRFAQRAGIDLRSLPYSFLVLERRGLRPQVPGRLPAGFSRIIGEPRIYKAFAKVLSCQSHGVRDLTVQKRELPDLFKSLNSRQAEAVYRWNLSGERITGAAALGEAVPP